MLRALLQLALPLVLPTVFYLLWVAFVRRRARITGSSDIPLVSEGPWVWLISGGLILVIAGLIAFALLDTSFPAGEILPPRFEDGVLLPAEPAPR